jgi:hypothetical protein
MLASVHVESFFESNRNLVITNATTYLAYIPDSIIVSNQVCIYMQKGD